MSARRKTRNRHHQHLGPGRDHLFPSQGPRWLAGPTDNFLAASDPHQFGDQWPQRTADHPLQQHHARPIRQLPRAAGDGVDPMLEPLNRDLFHEFSCPAARARPVAGRSRHHRGISAPDSRPSAGWEGCRRRRSPRLRPRHILRTTPGSRSGPVAAARGWACPASTTPAVFSGGRGPGRRSHGWSHHEG